MKYRDLLETLEKLQIFSVQDLKNLDDKFDKSKISKWKKSGYIQQIIRGYYFLPKIQINYFMLLKIANTLHSPSYISLESAFSYYSIIPEQAFNIASVGTKKTITFSTELATFDYRKIKSDLYFGYEVKEFNGNKIRIATLEKALLDYFYLNDTVHSLVDLEYLRFNKEILKERLDIDLLLKYSGLLHSKTVDKRIRLLIDYLQIGSI